MRGEREIKRFVGGDVLLDHPFVIRLAGFMTLSAADLNRLGRILEDERKIEKRKSLVVEGCVYEGLCFVKDGFAMRYKLLRTGKRQILNVILPGDVIGFPVSFFERSIYSITALTNLKFSICSIDKFVQLCLERPQFGLALSWLAVHELAIYAEHIIDIGRRTPMERLAHFLLEIHCRLVTAGRGNTTKFELPISQAVMADVLGMSEPHLNRVLQQMRSEKLITTNARQVELTDIASLRTLAQYQPLNLAPIQALAKKN